MSERGRGIRVLIASGRMMFREVLIALLEREADIRVVGQATTGREAIDKTRELDPDVLLMELALPALSGIEALRRLAGASCRARTIVLSDSPVKKEVIEALKLGARGLIHARTSTELFLKSIRAVSAGEYWIGNETVGDLIGSLSSQSDQGQESKRSSNFKLTARELEVVALLVEGRTNKEIAGMLSISEQTVKHHLTSIFEKVGVSGRLELVLFAMQNPVKAGASTK